VRADFMNAVAADTCAESHIPVPRESLAPVAGKTHMSFPSHAAPTEVVADATTDSALSHANITQSDGCGLRVDVPSMFLPWRTNRPYALLPEMRSETR
jgi:hypothetical protein